MSTPQAVAENRLATTIAMLATYATLDPAEEAFRLRMFALTSTAGDPFARSMVRPGHFTASAFVLSPDAQQLLLIRHRKLLRWLQPGGHFEPEDLDVFAATRREVAEETGVVALSPLQPGLFDVDIHNIPAHGGDDAHTHFDLRLGFRAHTWHLAETDEVDGVRWVPLRDVATLETDASVLRAVARLILRLRDPAVLEIIAGRS